MGHIGVITHLLTIDPNFLGRPSGSLAFPPWRFHHGHGIHEIPRGIRHGISRFDENLHVEMLASSKTNMAIAGNITRIFNRRCRYIFIHGCFSIVMLVFWAVQQQNPFTMVLCQVLIACIWVWWNLTPIFDLNASSWSVLFFFGGGGPDFAHLCTSSRAASTLWSLWM